MTHPLTPLLLALRHDGRQIDLPTADLIPASIEEAYAIQADVARQVPGGTRGWKVGMTSEAAMRARGRTEPVCARLFAATTFEDGQGSLPDVGGRRMFEAEYVFELARDLPRGAYGRDEMIAAIGAARPGIEICGSRFSTMGALDLFLSLADNSFHLGLVVGDPIEDWQARYLDEDVVIEGGGTMVTGSGREVLGDPLHALTWLAGMDLPDGGLKAGDLIATGVAAKLDVSASPATATARFGGRGAIVARLT